MEQKNLEDTITVARFALYAILTIGSIPSWWCIAPNFAHCVHKADNGHFSGSKSPTSRALLKSIVCHILKLEPLAGPYLANMLAADASLSLKCFSPHSFSFKVQARCFASTASEQQVTLEQTIGNEEEKETNNMKIWKFVKFNKIVWQSHTELNTLFQIFIFCPKIQLWFPEKFVDFLGEKLVKMLWFWTY